MAVCLIRSGVKLAFVCLACGMAASQGWAAQPLGCLIEPFRSADVGSPVIGVVESMLVERGDRVTKGQPLATLRADVERASLGVASSKAMAMGEINGAAANAELARQKLARAKDLVAQNFISAQALEQARAESTMADNRLTQAREQRAVFLREHDLAQAQLSLRTIRSPSTGVIADRFLSVGERVEEKPMFRVAVVDPLRVEVVLPAQMFTGMRPGVGMTITPEFPNAGARQAKVVLVDQLIDGASNTFRVRLELPNADMRLPAGLRCKAEMGAVVPASLQVAPGTNSRRVAGTTQVTTQVAAQVTTQGVGRASVANAGSAESLRLRIDSALSTRAPAKP
jgi:RND family efflux transporter MFP subunit